MCPRESRGTENCVCVCVCACMRVCVWDRESSEKEREHSGNKSSWKENAKEEIQLFSSEAKASGSGAIEWIGKSYKEKFGERILIY